MVRRCRHERTSSRREYAPDEKSLVTYRAKSPSQWANNAMVPTVATPPFCTPRGLDYRRSWYGMDYVSAVCSQGGYEFQETAPQKDVHSLDGQVFFRTGLAVGVQIKCTSARFMGKKSYLIEDAWRKNWEQLILPAYFVVVSVPTDTKDWIEHLDPARHTLHWTSAYWVRIDPLQPSQVRITVETDQRFTVDTLDAWCSDLEQATTAGFGRGGGTP